MNPLLFSSFGLLFIGITTTALIYWFGAHKIAGTPTYTTALGWTFAFAFFTCTFLGAAPFLIEQATWLLLLPFFGLTLCLLSIQRIVQNEAATNKNHQQG
jgi:hypothetical protein